MNALIATGRLERGDKVPPSPRGRIPAKATRRERMARCLRTKSGKADYATRKAIVEPAFGQMKVRQHAGKLRLRGLQGADGGWKLRAICHNLRKLANARPKMALGPPEAPSARISDSRPLSTGESRDGSRSQFFPAEFPSSARA